MYVYIYMNVCIYRLLYRLRASGFRKTKQDRVKTENLFNQDR